MFIYGAPENNVTERIITVRFTNSASTDPHKFKGIRTHLSGLMSSSVLREEVVVVTSFDNFSSLTTYIATLRSSISISLSGKDNE